MFEVYFNDLVKVIHLHIHFQIATHEITNLLIPSFLDNYSINTVATEGL